jgi:hypothetical protein
MSSAGRARMRTLWAQCSLLALRSSCVPDELSPDVPSFKESQRTKYKLSQKWCTRRQCVFVTHKQIACLPVMQHYQVTAA